MTGLVAVFRGEVRDQIGRPFFWLGALGTAATAVMFGLQSPHRQNGYVVFEAALGAGVFAAAFLLLGMSAIAVAGERTRGTVRWLLPRPVTRAGFVLGKACALGLAAVLYLAVVAGAAWTTARPHGFGDVVSSVETVDDVEDDGFDYIEDTVIAPEFRADEMRARVRTTVLLALAALLSATALGLLVSTLLRSSAAAVIVALGAALPVYFLPDVLGWSAETARFLPFRALTEFLRQLQEFGRGLSTAAWPAYGPGAVAGAALAIAGLPALGAAIFTRLDVTD